MEKEKIDNKYFEVMKGEVPWMEKIFKPRTIRTGIAAAMTALFYKVPCVVGEYAKTLSELYNMMMFSARDYEVQKKLNTDIGAKVTFFRK